jgi:hypothetical protein
VDFRRTILYPLGGSGYRRFSGAPHRAYGDRMADGFDFSHVEKGLTRFPPNVEQIRIERESTCIWLIARRNDVELRFSLAPIDCEHLAELLRGRT